MAMARQFFESQKTTALGPSFSPAQMAPIQDLVSPQLSLISANRGMPGFNDAWAEIQRTQGATGLPQTTFSSAAWASEFGPAAFASGPAVQQSLTPTNSAPALQFVSETVSDDVANSDAKPIFGRQCLRHGKPLRS
jgi:hypothetical protein